MMNRFFPALLLATVLAGCTTVGDPDIPRIALAVKEAATIGTSEAVRDHPEWRPHFEDVSNELELLEKQETITVGQLLEEINQLPVSELSSDRARLIMASARFTIAIAGWSDVELKQSEQVRPVIIALREGIDAGLASPMIPKVAGVGAKPKHYRPR